MIEGTRITRPTHIGDGVVIKTELRDVEGSQAVKLYTTIRWGGYLGFTHEYDAKQVDYNLRAGHWIVVDEARGTGTMLNEQMITSAYAELAAATQEYRNAENEQVGYKALLDADIAKALASGEITGKNETERQATARERFAIGFDELESLSKASRMAKLRHELAQIEVEKVRSLLRLAEVTSSVQAKPDERIPF